MGMFGINFGLMSNPDTMVAVAQAAEAQGFDSVWTGEHIVLPWPPQPAPSSSAAASSSCRSANQRYWPRAWPRLTTCQAVGSCSDWAWAIWNQR